MRSYSSSKRRPSSAHSDSLGHTPKMDANNLNANNSNTITTNDKTDDEVELKEKLENNKVASMFANDLLASPNFLRIPLKPLEKPSNDEVNNENP